MTMHRKARRACLTTSLGKGVGSLGSGIWNGISGKGGKQEEEADEGEGEQKSGGFFG